MAAGEALALSSSALWGTADFLGGTASRRLPTLAVVGASQLVGLLGVSLLAVLTGALDDPTGWVPWSIAAGAVGLVALAAFYAALAGGTMAVVAPIASLGAAVPAVAGLVAGERPGALQLLGIGVALTGVVLSSGPEVSARAPMRPIALAALAALGFGVVLLLIARGSASSATMTLVGMRATAAVVIVSLAVAVRSTGGVRAGDLPLLAAIGLADAAANWAYAVASDLGLLSVVGVLASLYPAVTVLLARAVHNERLRAIQNVGVVLALAGVAAIAAGEAAG